MCMCFKWQLFFASILYGLVFLPAFSQDRTDSYPINIHFSTDTSVVVYGSSSTLATNGQGFITHFDSLGAEIWSKELGDSLDDAIMSVTTFDSLIYFIGNSKIYGQDDNDFWIGCINNNGNYLWNRTIGSLSIDHGISITTDSLGYIYTGGNTQGIGSSLGGVMVAKLNQQGFLIWGNVYDGSGIDEIKIIKTLTNGKIIVAGKTTSSGLGDEDAFMLCVDSLGTVEWTRAYGGTGADEFRDVVYFNNYLYCVGSTTSFGFGDKDIWVTKIDLNGNWIWSKSIGDWLVEKSSVVSIINGKIMIGGYRQATGGLLDDMVYALMNESGSLTYCNTIQMDNKEYLTRIHQKTNGDILLAGSGLDSVWQSYVFKLDSNDQVCENTTEALDIGNLNISAVPQFWNEQSIMTSVTTQTHTNTEEVLAQGSNIIDFCYSSTENIDTNGTDTTEVMELRNSSLVLNIHPNPSFKEVTFTSCDVCSFDKLTIFSNTGQLIREYQGTTTKVVAGDLPEGSYVAEIKQGDAVLRKLFIVL